ncbi:MAG: hypothetical protein EON59_14720, partial [Alphaproteobacteria bacterium]
MSVNSQDARVKAERIQDHVEANLPSILHAIEARIRGLETREELIRIDLGDDGTICVDLAAGTAQVGAPDLSAPTSTLTVSPRFMARVMNGKSRFS